MPPRKKVKSGAAAAAAAAGSSAGGGGGDDFSDASSTVSASPPPPSPPAATANGKSDKDEKSTLAVPPAAAGGSGVADVTPDTRNWLSPAVPATPPSPAYSDAAAVILQPHSLPESTAHTNSAANGSGAAAAAVEADSAPDTVAVPKANGNSKSKVKTNFAAAAAASASASSASSSASSPAATSAPVASGGGACAWIGRQSQRDALLRYIDNSNVAVSALYLFGPTGTGKTALLKHVLAERRSRFVYVDCTDSTNEKVIYGRIIKQLTGASAGGSDATEPAPPPAAATSVSAAVAALEAEKKMAFRDRMSEFVIQFAAVTEPFDIPTAAPPPAAASTAGASAAPAFVDWRAPPPPVYIVFDHVQKLSAENPHLLGAFFRLGELTGRSVCLLLVGTTAFASMRAATGGFDVITIPFPLYSRDELTAIVSHDVYAVNRSIRAALTADEFHGLVSYLCSVFESGTRNLHELLHLTRLLQPKFLEIVATCKARGTALSRTVWSSSLKAHIQAATRELFHRDFSVDDLMAVGTAVPTARAASRLLGDSKDGASATASAATTGGTAAGSAASGADVVVPLELPISAKYLLLAAFLASYNPAQEDKRIFTTHTSTVKRKSSSAAAGAGGAARGGKVKRKFSSLLFGPKPFPLDRLIAIFKAIYPEQHSIAVAGVYTHISSLASLSLLSYNSLKSRRADLLEDVKLRCNVTHAQVTALARSLQPVFELHNYLYSPNG